MAVKTPVKATFTGSNVTGLAEYQAADFIGVADGGSGAVTFTAGILTADGTNAFTTVTAPSGTIVGTSDTQTLTNKTINSASNTITITESNISDLGSYITASSTDTLTNKTIDAASNTLSNIGNSSLTNSSITVTDGSTSTATSLGGTITFSGTANEIEVGESSGTITVGLPDNVSITTDLTVGGDLTVNGTTTTVNSTTLTVDDKNIELGSVATPSDTTADGGGITLKGATDKTLNWVNSTDSWTSSEHLDLASGKEFKINSSTVLTSSQVLGKSLPTGDVIGTSDTQTLTNKTINLSSNTLTGTTAQFNTALSDGSFATLAGTETLTNKTISALTVTGQAHTVTDTTSGSSAGPEFSLVRDITGVDGNYIGQIKFVGDSDTGTQRNYAKITGKIGDASNGSEDGIIEIAHIKDGSQNINVRMTSTEFKIMNGTDFDVETHDGSSNGLRLANTLVTATAAELNYSDGVTSNIQTQLDAKATNAFAIAQAVALG